MLSKLLIFIVCLFFSYEIATFERPMAIIIPSYQNEKWYKRNLNSIVRQKYNNWRVVYIDDCSSDGTADYVSQYIQDRHLENKIVLIKNEQRQGALANLYYAIHSCADNEIIVTVDGDDWLAHDNVLSIVNGVYARANAWLTYGQYRTFPKGFIGGNKRLPINVIRRGDYRSSSWYTTHLRTFYAWLFKLIKREDLLYKNNFYPVAWDLAIMFPMLEMSAGHAVHIPQDLYIYNVATPLNDYKVHAQLQKELAREIRSKSKYNRLLSRPK